MRRRRAIIIDDEPVVLDVLKIFLEMRDYDVVAFTEPLRCMVYKDYSFCDKLAPCADVLLTDYRMPKMSGLDLLMAQASMGCRLTPKNKALVSGYLDPSVLKRIGELGCHFFHKPVVIEELNAWLDECETRIDLTRPLALPRKEMREAFHLLLSYRIEGTEEARQASAVNRSSSGLCLEVDRRPTVNQVWEMICDLPLPSKRATVRWTENRGEGKYLVGLSCC
ncbi:MAG: response regulator [Nitrospiraceae bacterium]|nr:response regulator [Nitrospiraceae bacterium]